MKNHLFVLSVVSVLALGGMTVIACSDDSSTPNGTSSGNPLNPDTGTSSGSSGTSGSSGSSGSSGDGGSCTGTNPPNCFCGTPTTQAEFLNRCTTAVAIPVNLTVKAATTADEP